MRRASELVGGILLTFVAVLLLAAGPVSVQSQGLPTPTSAPAKNPVGASADLGPARAIPDITLDGRLHFIDFYADWCGPCIDMRPHIATMEGRYSPMIHFWRVDVDTRESDRLEAYFGGVPAIPLVVVLDAQGRTLARIEGFQSERQLDRLLRDLFAQTGTRKPDRLDTPPAGERAAEAPATAPGAQRTSSAVYPRN